MKRYLFITIFSLALVATGCMREEVAGPEQANPSEDTNGYPLENGEYIQSGVLQVKLSPEAEARFNPISQGSVFSTGVASIDILCAQLGVTEIKRTFSHGGKHEKTMREAGLHRWYNIYFDGKAKGTMTRAYNDFSELDDLEYVEPVIRIKRIEDTVMPVTRSDIEWMVSAPRSGDIPLISSGFDDPLLSYQWHYHNEGTLYQAKPGADINLLEAWKIEQGKPQVIVAIIDGGIDVEHPDLKQNLWVNQAEMNGVEGADDDNNDYIDDIHGFNFVTGTGKVTAHAHGTHVAGTVGAVNNNGIGVSGVAGGNGSPDSGVRLMSCQIFHRSDNGKELVVKDEERGNAFIYAANNGAVIAQNSWEYAWTGVEKELMESDREAIDYFIEHAGKDGNGIQTGPLMGGIVIFATGNGNLNAKVLPSSYEKVFSVSSYAPSYRRADYSNYGAWVHVSAPGGRGEYADGRQIFSTYPMGLYGFMEGTSMACPHVSGIAALVVSKFGLNPDGTIKPGFTNEQLKARLLHAVNETIQWFNPAEYPIGKGYINAHKALANDGDIAPDRVGDIAAQWIFDKATVTWRVTADSDDSSEKTDHYKVVVSEEELYGLDFSRLPGRLTAVTVATAGKNVGDQLSLELTSLEADKKYYISIAGFDTDGNISPSSTIKGSLIPNRGPVAVDVPSGVSLRKGESRYYDITVTDPEGYPWVLSDFVSGSSGATAVRIGNTNTLRLTFNSNGVTPGTYTAILTLKDQQGVQTVVTIPYTVIFYAPQLLKDFENVLYQGAGHTTEYTLTDHFYDQDGDPMTFLAASANTSVATVVVTGNKLTVTSTGFGTSQITVKASDVNADTEASFNVTCRDAGQKVDLYPVPVKKDGVLNIRMGEDVDGLIDVNIYSMSGSKVFGSQLRMQGGTAQQVNISALTTGNYRVVVKYRNEEITRNITKL